MSFKDRVNRRLDRWLSFHPTATEAEKKRKAKKIAAKLRAEEDEPKPSSP
jgi:hypothetical protein